MAKKQDAEQRFFKAMKQEADKIILKDRKILEKLARM